MAVARRNGSSLNNGSSLSNGSGSSHGSSPSTTLAPTAAPARPALRKSASSAASSAPTEERILFQKYFKSAGPRTYAAQIKEARNGNHYLVLTEGRRDSQTEELRKTRLWVFSEDFVAFFRMLHEAAQFIRANPVPESVRAKRARKNRESRMEDRGQKMEDRR